MAGKTLVVGRSLTLVSILAFALTLSLWVPAVGDYVNSHSGVFAALNVFGALGAFCTFAAWGLAIFHWGQRSFDEARTKRRWGVGVTLGLFIGAWVYWLFGTEESSSAAKPSI
jgi:hypothetical protein